MTSGRFILMGTGTSGGMPLIACDCATCTSDDPRDRRTRAAGCVQWIDGAGKPRCVLIDAGPDLHEQALRHGLWRCDAIVFTHNHVDHIFGLDEVRRFNAVMRRPIDILAEPYVLESLRRVYKHVFDRSANVNDSFVATLIQREVHAPEERGGAGAAVELWGMRFTPIRLFHGRLPVLGWRVEPTAALRGAAGGEGEEWPWPVAYCTDVSSIPTESWRAFEGVRTLVLDALRFRHHPTHFTVDQAVDAALRIGARRTYFTHMSHEVRHAEVDPTLPEGIALGYDGLVLGSLGEAGERAFAEDRARLAASVRKLDPGGRAGSAGREGMGETGAGAGEGARSSFDQV
ncbi:MAG: MBL fold metallo-hydrolase [Planctomycetota bacterium]|nr:MBL fold metallo-hydrolase [Planctomycetota bacterium]